MARRLREELARIPRVAFTQRTESNAVFAILPSEHIAKLQSETFFYVWNEATSEVRFMTSFDTTEEDVLRFAEFTKRVLA